MADNEAAPAKKGGWLKGIFGAVGGMVSGVVVMYLTPWVDKVAKPPAPVANFSVEYDGATVHFQNQSQPRGEGWWDFGDGSPLVPVSSDTEFLAHTYPRPGDYTVKLAIHNVLGEANERSVPIRLDGAAAAPKPRITSLEAVPAHQCGTGVAAFAPATFRLLSTVEQANLYVWDYGDERPIEVTADAAKCRHVTFPKPGRYVVKLVAINGTQHDERCATITVAEAPATSLSLVLNVSDNATRVEKEDRQVNLGVTLPAEFTGNAYPFARPFKASPGYTIADVLVPPCVPNAPPTHLGTQTAMTLDCAGLGIRSARTVQLQLSPDRQLVTVTGELVRQTGLTALSMPVVLRQQRRVAAHQANPVTATLALPNPGGTTSTLLHLPPIPPDWVDSQRSVLLEVRSGGQVIWQGSQLPRGALVTVGGRRCVLTTTLTAEQMRVDLADAPATN
jgi:PKD repeat protein